MELGVGKSGKNENKGKFRKICVFCGSREGYKSSFGDAAIQLGKLMVERNIDLVYGGGSVGLMGLISQTVFNGGCHVLGVIPKALMPHEISGKTNGEVKKVADMHQRKSEMAKHADAFIALPGGYGTMEEVLEIIAWSQLGIHEKPVGLLNVDGYYDSLLALFDKGVEEGFIEDSARNIAVSAYSAHELINKMEEYEAIHDRVAPRQSWEVDQILDSTKSGILFVRRDFMEFEMHFEEASSETSQCLGFCVIPSQSGRKTDFLTTKKETVLSIKCDSGAKIQTVCKQSESPSFLFVTLENRDMMKCQVIVAYGLNLDIYSDV